MAVSDAFAQGNPATALEPQANDRHVEIASLCLTQTVGSRHADARQGRRTPSAWARFAPLMSFGLNSTATLSDHGLDESGYGFTFQPVVCQTGHPIGDPRHMLQGQGVTTRSRSSSCDGW